MGDQFEPTDPDHGPPSKVGAWALGGALGAVLVALLSLGKHASTSAPDHSVEWTQTCRDLWMQELGRPIDPPALVDCLANAKAGKHAPELRQPVHDSDEAIAYRKSLETPPPPAFTARQGIVTLDGHAFRDDDGEFLGVGVSLFWAGWGCLHDRERLETRNLAPLKGRADYIRVLAIVGPAGWRDRTVTASEMESAVACVTDLAHDVYGLRVDWTIFGAIDTTPTHADREDLVRRFIDVAKTRVAKIHRVQVANEGWQNGFGGTNGGAELREFATQLHRELPNIVSLTSPQPATPTRSEADDVAAWYLPLGFSDRLLVAVHPDRNVSGQGGMWRPVRQAWDPKDWSRLPWDADEPIGPRSSVAMDDNPLRLVMGAAYTWLCGGAGWTFHSGAGVRGGGYEDTHQPDAPTQPKAYIPRQANLDEETSLIPVLDALVKLRTALPLDLPNFHQHNSNPRFPGYPFQTDAIVPLLEANTLLRAFGATSDDGRFVVMPIVATVPIPFTAKAAMQLQVRDPMTLGGEAMALATGDTYTLPPREAAILIGSRR